MALYDALLTDLAFDGDLKVNPTGDFDVMSGLTNVRAAILRRIMTKKGSIIHRPEYGCGLIEMQNGPATLAMQRQLASRIVEQLPRDNRIVKVLSVSVSSDDYTPEKLVVGVSVEVLGYGAAEFTYTPFSEATL